MMKNIILLLFLLFLTGCCTIPPEKGQNVNQREISNSDEQLKQLGTGILTALQQSDYQSFAKHVNNDENKISEDEFQVSEKNIRNQFGRITGFEYLTDLETPLMHNLIWKVQFEREGKNQKTVKQELLFRLILGTINGKPHVISMSFL